MKKLLSLSIVFIFHLFFCPFVVAQSNSNLKVLDYLPQVNGPVNFIAKDTASRTLYLSGEFTEAGGFENSRGVFLNNQDGLFYQSHPKIDGTVYSSIPDGNGGWYIGGNFTKVGGKERFDLAQIDSSGHVTDFFEGMKTDGRVMSMCKDNANLYFGGQFTRVGKSSAKYAALLNAIGGGEAVHLEGFNGPVFCGSSDSAGGWYVGGFFTMAGGKPRTHLAHILADGSIADWAPMVDDTVFAIAFDQFSNSVWAGGALDYYYTSIKGSTNSNYKPQHLVRIDPLTAEVSDPFEYFVTSLSNFSSVHGRWQGTVRSIYIQLINEGPDVEIFVGCDQPGYVYQFGNSSCLQKLKPIKPIPPMEQWQLQRTIFFFPFNPGYNSVRAIFIHPSIPDLVFAGGRLLFENNHQGDRSMKNLVVFNRTTGQAYGLYSYNSTSYKYDPDGPVHCIAAVGDTIYFGGEFSTIGGMVNSTYPTAVNRQRLFAININGTLTNWNPGADSTVLSLVSTNDMLFAGSGDMLIAGGLFSTIGGQPRKHLAMISTNGIPALWDPSPDSAVHVLLYKNPFRIFLGGRFTWLSNMDFVRHNLASIDIANGRINSWNPGTSLDAERTKWWYDYKHPFNYPPTFASTIYRYKDFVADLKIGGNTVFVAGRFSTAGGVARRNFAGIDASNGQITFHDPSPNGNVNKIILTTDRIFIGGEFDSCGSVKRSALASLSISTGLTDAWNPGSAFGSYYTKVSSLVRQNQDLYAGGTIFLNSPSNEAIVSIDISSAAITKPLKNYIKIERTDALYLSGNKLLIGGRVRFTTDTSVARHMVLPIDLNSGDVSNWSCTTNDTILTISHAGNKIFAGGRFTHSAGIKRQFAMAVNYSNGEILPWNPKASSPPAFLLPHNGLVYAAGSFSRIGGQLRKSIAALDAVSGLATAWNPGLNATYKVNSLASHGNYIYAGGDFDSIGGIRCKNLAELNTMTGASTSWNPAPDKAVTSLATCNDLLYAGGYFDTVFSISKRGFAEFNMLSNLLTPWTYTNLSYPDNLINESSTPLYRKVKLVKDSLIGFLSTGTGISFDTVLPNGKTRVHNLSKLSFKTAWNPYSGNTSTDTAHTEYAYLHDFCLKASGGDTISGELTPIQIGNTWYQWNGLKYFLRLHRYGFFTVHQPNFDDWIEINGPVYTMESVDDSVFIGGTFDKIAGVDGSNFTGFANGDSCFIYPKAPDLTANGTFCYGDSLELRPTPYSGIYNYEWRGPNGFYSTLAKPKIYNYNDSNAGQYTCRLKVSSSACWSEASSMTIPIRGVPVQAGINAPCPGDSLLLRSSAHPADYAWSGPNGFTSPLQNHVIPGIQLSDSGHYIVTATETGCPPHTDTVQLSFGPATILSQPLDRHACSGENAYFSVTARGSALGYQWQIYTNGWNNLSDDTYYLGTQSAVLSVLSDTPLTCRSFRCLVSSGCYPAVYSDSVTLKPGKIYPGITVNSGTCSPAAQITSLSSLTLCKKDSLTINYVYSGGIDCGTDSVFVELSDSSGSFASTVLLGSKAFDLSGSIKILVPCSIPNSTEYRIRIVLSRPWIQGPDNGSNLSISDCLPSPVTISSNAPVCQGGTLVLNSSQQNNYKWTKGGFVYSTLQNPVISPVNSGSSGYYTLSVDWACGTKKDSLRVDIVTNPGIFVPLPSMGPGGVIVRLSGYGLNPVAANNQVWMGQAKASISFIDTNRLDLIAPVNGTYGPITITDLQCGLSAQSIDPFFVTDACPKPLNALSTFATAVSFSLGASASNVRSAPGDIDGDGKLDIIVRNGTTGALQILRNNTIPGTINTSSFLPAVNFSPPSALQGNEEILVHDFDNDGKQDVLCNSSAYPFFWLWRNTATSGSINASSLATPIPFGTGIGSAKGMAISDFNRDGKTDIAAGDSVLNVIWIYRNSSVPGMLQAPSLTNPTFINSSATRPTKALAAADLNGDQYPDLVQLCSNGKISIYLGAGGFGFQTPVDFTAQANPTCLAIADLDKDYKPDIIIGYGPGTTGLSYWRNTSISGSLSLATRSDLGTSVPAVRITPADINGDGKVDLVTANNNNANTGNSFSAWPNTSQAPFITFSPVVNFSTATGPHTIQVADFDSSGSKDVLVTCSANTSVQVLRNFTTPTATPIVSASGSTTMCSGDSIMLTCSPALTYLWNTGATTQSITVSTSGDYFVMANNCEVSLTTTVTVKSIPSAINLSGGGILCITGSPATISLNTSQSGVTYHLLRNGSFTGDSLTGTGSALSFSNILQAGSYTISATTDSSVCSSTMSGSALFTQQSIPNVFNVTGGGSYCFPEDSGAYISLSGTEIGVNYQLMRDSILVGTVLPGTGNSITFPMQDSAGVYTIRGIMGGCSAAMSGSAGISRGANPLVFTVSGGGNYCSSPGTGTTIIVDSSQYDVRYRLYKNGSGLPSTDRVGSNSALTFNAVTDTGSYSVLALNLSSGCSVYMNGTALVTMTPHVRYYRDYDMDGFGDSFNFTDTCGGPMAGYITNGGDCNDSSTAINFNLPEICFNDIDDNCNGGIDEGCYTYITLRVLIEGFYLGNSTMIAVADPVNMPGICDTITLSLADSATLTILHTDTAVIDTSGFGLFRMPLTTVNTSCYLVVRHRNSIETWSKTPVAPAQLGFFDFTANDGGALKVRETKSMDKARRKSLQGDEMKQNQ